MNLEKDEKLNITLNQHSIHKIPQQQDARKRLATRAFVFNISCEGLCSKYPSTRRSGKMELSLDFEYETMLIWLQGVSMKLVKIRGDFGIHFKDDFIDLRRSQSSRS